MNTDDIKIMERWKREDQKRKNKKGYETAIKVLTILIIIDGIMNGWFGRHRSWFEYCTAEDLPYVRFCILSLLILTFIWIVLVYFYTKNDE